MREEFICEPLKPITESIDPSTMAPGEPGLPRKFIWRKQEYQIECIINKWKETGPCKNGGGEMYVRKHWFHIKTTDGTEMKIHFERQARSKSQRAQRWWIYCLVHQDQ